MTRKELIKAGAAAVKKAHKGSISEIASKALEFPTVWGSTGSLSLDRLCSGKNPGGVPMGASYGRIIHIAGEWSTGKSLILDHMFKSVLVDLEGLAVCTETEGSRDPHFANAIGLPLNLLTIQRPETFEEAFDMFIKWHEGVRAQDESIPIIWGFDSLDSTQAEKAASKGLSEGGGWHFGGGRSEALGAGLRKIALLCSRYPTTLVMLNQTRDNVGMMFGPKKTTPGGNPPHFYASLELMLTAAPRANSGYVRAEVPLPELSQAALQRLGFRGISEKGTVLGRYIRAKNTKTKMALTLDTTADFYIDFRKGIHKWEGLAERLMFEGRLKTDTDGSSQYAMPDVIDKEQPGNVGVGPFETKKDWLNWLSAHMEVLDGQVEESPEAVEAEE